MKRSTFTLWRITLKLTGWWPIAISFIVLTGFFLIETAARRASIAPDPAYAQRAVETVAPLLFAVQAAFLLGPDNEAALELLLSYPKPLPRLFLERLGLLAGIHAILASTATLVFTLAWHAEAPVLAVVRWLAAGILLGGVAAFTTQLTRQGIFGTLMVTLLWAASLYGGDGIMKRWPWFWHFHVYLQPDKTTAAVYAVNRLSFILAGLALMALASFLLRNDERMLGNK